MYDPDDRHDVRRAPVSVSARPRHGGWGHCPKNLVGCSKVHLLASCFLAGEFGLPSVFENAYFTFFSDLKNMTFYVFEMTYQKVVKVTQNYQVC